MKDRRRRGIREGTAGEVRGGPGGEARSIPERIRDRILRLRARGLGSQAIADQANAWPVPTARGGRWWASKSGPCSCTTEPPIRLRGLQALNVASGRKEHSSLQGPVPCATSCRGATEATLTLERSGISPAAQPLGPELSTSLIRGGVPSGVVPSSQPPDQCCHGDEAHEDGDQPHGPHGSGEGPSEHEE